MEVVVKCIECNGIMEEYKMEKEFGSGLAIYVSPTCDCYDTECDE